jgi:hypothetical protein
MLEGLGDSVAMMHVLALPPRLSYIHNATDTYQLGQFGNGLDIGGGPPLMAIVRWCAIHVDMYLVWLLQ